MTSILLTCAVLGLGLPGAICDRGGHARTIPPPARGGAALAPSNIDIGREMSAKRGWVGEEWRCLALLWSRESGWQVSDPNPASQADGIPQANPASKMASAGPLWRTDARTQIRWGLSYIKARYGHPCGAWANSQSAGYY
jgi:hypothetical protein